MRISGSLLLAAIILPLNGCFVCTTRCLWNRGVTVEVIDQPRSIRVGADGSLALDIQAIYGTPPVEVVLIPCRRRWCSPADEVRTYNDIVKRRRFLIVPPEVLADPKTGTDQAVTWVRLNDPRCHLIPPGFGDDDATESDLPALYAEAEPVVVPEQPRIDHADLSIPGHQDTVPVGFLPSFHRRQRSWWGWGMTIFTPVTIGIDAACASPLIAIFVAASPITVPVIVYDACTK